MALIKNIGSMEEQNIIFYNTEDKKVRIALMAKDGQVWMNQSQLAELFATSTQNVSLHINNILKDNELKEISVIKDYLITASDGKEYKVKFYSLDMILAARYEEFDKRRKIEDAKNADIEDMKELYKLLEKK